MMLYRRYRGKRDLCRIVDDYKPDIIHTNVGPLDIANNVAKKRKITHVWHIREYQDVDFNMHFYPSRKCFYKKIHHENNHLIAITHNIFGHFNMKATDRVIYDGVFEKMDKRLEVDKSDYFLFVGSLKEAKGLKLLLLAYIEYVKNGGQYRLLIAGEGGPKSYKDECVKLIEENNLNNRITFLGFRDDVYALMQKAKALVVPSRFEGFGFITAEAMHNSCLVIGRDTGGTKEQFDNGLNMHLEEIGLRFSSKEELEHCLHKVEGMDDSAFEQILDNAFETVNGLYNNDICVERVLDFFLEVVDGRK